MITFALWLICEPEGREKWRFDFRLFQLFYLLIIFLSNKEGLSTFLFSQRLGWKRIYFLSFNLSSCVMRKYPDAKLGSAQADILWRGNVFWYLPGFAVPGVSNICVQSGDGERSSAGEMGWCRRKHSFRESEFGSAFGCVPRGGIWFTHKWLLLRRQWPREAAAGDTGKKRQGATVPSVSLPCFCARV